MAATWTRIVVVPSRTFYYPDEEEKDEDCVGAFHMPEVGKLSSARRTIPQNGKAIKDNWRIAVREETPNIVPVMPGDFPTSELWVRKCVFCIGGQSCPERKRRCILRCRT